MKKFITQLSVLAVFALAGMYILDGYFTSVFKTGKTNKTQWVYQIHDTEYDVAMLGSSKAWWNIDMNVMSDELNRSCISLANNHFTFSEMHLRLKQFYANNNAVKDIYLETEYWWFFQEEGVSVTVYNNLPFIDDTLTYNHLIKQSDEWRLFKYFPFWRYAEYNFQWGVEELLVTKAGMRRTIFDSTGTFFTNNIFYGTDEFVAPPAESSEPNSDFLKIVAFCKEKGIKLHMFSSPVYHAKREQEWQNKLNDKMKELELEYVDYTDLFNDSTYFNDNSHLSIAGGEVFTQQLIKDIKEQK